MTENKREYTWKEKIDDSEKNNSCEENSLSNDINTEPVYIIILYSNKNLKEKSNIITKDNNISKEDKLNLELEYDIGSDITKDKDSNIKLNNNNISKDNLTNSASDLHLYELDFEKENSITYSKKHKYIVENILKMPKK